MFLFAEPSTSQAFYIVIGAVITFIIGLAAFITAVGVIYSKVVKPVRDKWDERIFNPLEQATKKVVDISETLHRIESRVFDMEEVFKKFDLEVFSGKLEQLSIDSAYAKFKLRLQSQFSQRAIFILDENGECEFVNYALCELMDADSTELEGNNWLKRVVVGERQMVENEWQDAYKRRRKFDMEQTVYVAGQRKKIRVQAEPFVYLDKVQKFYGEISLIE